MDVVVKGRKVRVSPQTRNRLERKAAHLARLEPRLQRLEVEIIRENPRIDGGHRVEASCRARRRTFRATGTGTDLEAAVDQMVERLERQITDDGRKRRARLIEGANRVKSGRIAASREQTPASPEEE